VAAQQAAQGQRGPTPCAVALEGLLGVHAAARVVAAIAADEGGEGHSIGLNQHEEQPGGEPGCRAGRRDAGVGP